MAAQLPRTDWNRAIWQPVKRVDGHLLYDPGLVLQEIGERLVALYPEAFKTGGESLPVAPAFGHLFAGLVQLADWLGSDTRFFEYSHEHEDRAATAPCYAAKAVAALGLNMDAWRARLDASGPTLHKPLVSARLIRFRRQWTILASGRW